MRRPFGHRQHAGRVARGSSGSRPGSRWSRPACRSRRRTASAPSTRSGPATGLQVVAVNFVRSPAVVSASTALLPTNECMCEAPGRPGKHDRVVGQPVAVRAVGPELRLVADAGRDRVGLAAPCTRRPAPSRPPGRPGSSRLGRPRRDGGAGLGLAGTDLPAARARGARPGGRVAPPCGRAMVPALSRHGGSAGRPFIAYAAPAGGDHEDGRAGAARPADHAFCEACRPGCSGPPRVRRMSYSPRRASAMLAAGPSGSPGIRDPRTSMTRTVGNQGPLRGGR